MSQHDFVTDNGTGLAVRTDIIAALQALATLSSGGTAPSTTYADQLWLDTSASPPVLWVRNAGNTAWDLLEATNGVFETRAAVVAATIAADVNILRTMGYATAGDGGGALYKRGSEPSHNLKIQSADTAWWEIVPDAAGINVKQAGALADDDDGSGGTDASSAFQDCVDYFYYIDVLVPSFIKPGGRVIVPAGEYFLASHIELKHTVILEGHGVGAGGVRSGTKLRFAADVDGIVINSHNTINGGTEETATGSAAGSIIRQLYIDGGGGTFDSAVGVWFRSRGTLEHCSIRGFSGHGISIVASSGAGGSLEGNANNWRINNVRVELCDNCGLFLDLGDVNAGVCTLLDSSANGRWGIWDSGFLGNTYIGCHVASNGMGGSAGNGTNTSSVWDSGTLYFANASASEADLVATAAGTDETVWRTYNTQGAASAASPQWLSSQPEGTYFHGGAYRTDNPNARHTLLGCYSEGGQSPAQVVNPTTILGGLHGADIFTDVIGGGMAQFGSDFSLGKPNFINPDDTFGMKVRLNMGGDNALQFDIAGEVTSQMFIWFDSAKVWLLGVSQNNNIGAAELLNPGSTRTLGRSSAPDRGMIAGNGFWPGNWSVARSLGFHALVPSVGDTAIGDLALNNLPNNNGVFGWSSVTQGSPGTQRALWKVPTFDSAMSLPQIAVASLPAAATANKDHVVYCTDGDTGSPCLAVSNGTDWLRVVFGAAVAAS